MLSPWIPCVLFAAVIIIGIPLLCWLVGDDPRNEITQEQGNEPRKPAEMTLAA